MIRRRLPGWLGRSLGPFTPERRRAGRDLLNAISGPLDISRAVARAGDSAGVAKHERGSESAAPGRGSVLAGQDARAARPATREQPLPQGDRTPPPEA